MLNHRQPRDVPLVRQGRCAATLGNHRSRWGAIAIARDATVVRRCVPGSGRHRCSGSIGWFAIGPLLMATGSCSRGVGFGAGRPLQVTDHVVTSRIRGCRRRSRTVGQQTDGEQDSQQDGPDRHSRKLTVQAGALGKPRLTQHPWHPPMRWRRTRGSSGRKTPLPPSHSTTQNSSGRHPASPRDDYARNAHGVA